jgi:anti-sigma B factor antagonist
MNPEFSIHVYREEDRHRLVPTGELDLASASVLEGTAANLCRERATELMVDLRQVDFMDSSGIHALLSVKDICEDSACGFCIVPGPPQVQRLFRITGLDGLPFCEPASESGQSTPLSPEPA